MNPSPKPVSHSLQPGYFRLIFAHPDASMDVIVQRLDAALKSW